MSFPYTCAMGHGSYATIHNICSFEIYRDLIRKKSYKIEVDTYYTN